MAEFTGEVLTVEAFDLLTVIVMVEQCEPELTVVTFWKVPSFKYAQTGELQQFTWCLQCLLKDVTNRSVLDGRAAVIDRVKNGTLQVTSIGPRSDTWRCPRCSSHLNKVNTEWRNFLTP